MTTKVQVYPEPAGDQWSVKVTGDEERETQTFATKDEAVQTGQRLAQETGGELAIHDNVHKPTHTDDSGS
ncbi:MAG TPA: DUF2188 domain-containing protein [Actinomycetota bacterium]|nr:DUF2188 domain-containing protein [Actinomycetota bacterium]